MRITLPRHMSMICVRLFGAYLLFASIASPSAAYDAKLHFDPARCSSPHDERVYFAVGRYVFGWAQEGLSYILDYSPDQPHETLEAPVPTDPEGCLGNPIQAFSYQLTAKKIAVSAVTHPISASLNISVGRDGDRGMQPAHAKTFPEWCARWNVVDHVKPGITGCAVRPQNPGVPREIWGELYRIENDVLPTPDGEPLFVMCANLNAFECMIDYVLLPKLYLYYSLNANGVPITAIVELDSAVRGIILSSRVQDYAWRNIE